MRSGKVKKRPLQPDTVYKSRIVSKTINSVMQSGKKSIAEHIVYGALGKLSEDKKQALSLFEEAIKNVMPKQEVRSRRIGGATYQVPVPVRHARAESLAIRWLLSASKSKKGKPMDEKFFQELKNASENMGDAIRKRDEVHKMAEANRAFAHFRF